ncbi:hypothetical protein AALA21_06120 [Eggerthellaceae bacterium 3-80]
MDKPQRTSTNDMKPTTHPADDRVKLYVSFNKRLSHVCRVVALIVVVVALATLVLGQENSKLVMMGLCVAVGLLALASLQDNHHGDV